MSVHGGLLSGGATSPTVVLYVLAWLTGAALTSFGRLAAMRWPHQARWRADADPDLTLWAPRSRCDGCGHAIGALHLMPVLGWCLVQGHCPSCAMRLSWSHPLLELLGGLGWVGWLWRFGLSGQGAAACLLWQFLLFLAELDWRERRLPAGACHALICLGLLVSPFEPVWLLRVGGAGAALAIMWLAALWFGRAGLRPLLAGGGLALCTATGAWLGAERLLSFLLPLLVWNVWQSCRSGARRL